MIRVLHIINSLGATNLFQLLTHRHCTDIVPTVVCLGPEKYFDDNKKFLNN